MCRDCSRPLPWPLLILAMASPAQSSQLLSSPRRGGADSLPPANRSEAAGADGTTTEI